MGDKEIVDKIVHLAKNFCTAIGATNDEVTQLTAQLKDQTAYQALDLVDHFLNSREKEYQKKINPQIKRPDFQHSITEIRIELHALQDDLIIRDLTIERNRCELLRWQKQDLETKLGQANSEIALLSVKLKRTEALALKLQEIERERIEQEERKQQRQSSRCVRWRWNLN